MRSRVKSDDVLSEDVSLDSRREPFSRKLQSLSDNESKDCRARVKTLSLQLISQSWSSEHFAGVPICVLGLKGD